MSEDPADQEKLKQFDIADDLDQATSVDEAMVKTIESMRRCKMSAWEAARAEVLDFQPKVKVVSASLASYIRACNRYFQQRVMAEKAAKGKVNYQGTDKRQNRSSPLVVASAELTLDRCCFTTAKRMIGLKGG